MSNSAEDQQPRTPRRNARHFSRTSSSPGIKLAQSQSQSMLQNLPRSQVRQCHRRRSARGDFANHHRNQNTPERNDTALIQHGQSDLDGNSKVVPAVSQDQTHDSGTGTGTGKKQKSKRRSSQQNITCSITIKNSNSSNYNHNKPNNSSVQQDLQAASLANLPFPTLSGTPHKPYAGPTFHSSPAASALPMPKFFSKSVPNPTSNAQTMQARADYESGNGSGCAELITPVGSPNQSQVQTPVPISTIDSPLDLFFTADRAEKAKGEDGSRSATVPCRPNAARITRFTPPPPYWASVYGSVRSGHNRTSFGGSGKGLFMMELDGSNTFPRPAPSRPLPQFSRAVTEPALLHNISNRQDGLATPIRLSTNRVASGKNCPASYCMPTSGMERSSTSPFGSSSTLPVIGTAPKSADDRHLETLLPQANEQHSQPHYGNRVPVPSTQTSTTKASSRFRSRLSQEYSTGPVIHEHPANNSAMNRTKKSTSVHEAASNFLSSMIDQVSSASMSPKNLLGAPSRSPVPKIPCDDRQPDYFPIRQQQQKHLSDPEQQSDKTASMERDLRKLLKISKN